MRNRYLIGIFVLGLISSGILLMLKSFASLNQFKRILNRPLTMTHKFGPPVVMGEESLMSEKKHGSCETPPQDDLRYGVDWSEADKICCYNRHYAEYSGYFLKTDWLDTISKTEPTEYYDSVSGKLLFTAPIGRTFEEFLKESKNHGWPSFRDEEVNWDAVRVLPDRETVSVDGTHLGHNIPDAKGNRYCINLVSISGNPI